MEESFKLLDNMEMLPMIKKDCIHKVFINYFKIRK